MHDDGVGLVLSVLVVHARVSPAVAHWMVIGGLGGSKALVGSRWRVVTGLVPITFVVVILAPSSPPSHLAGVGSAVRIGSCSLALGVTFLPRSIALTILVIGILGRWRG